MSSVDLLYLHLYMFSTSTSVDVDVKNVGYKKSVPHILVGKM